MIAPPSTETPRHTATPWAGNLSVDLRKGALSVSADGLTLIDEKHVCWGIIFPDKTGNYDHAVTFTESVNSHAALTAKVAELEAALRDLRDDRRLVLGSVHRKRIASLLDNEVTWPGGCHDPDSCARHKACMYVQCGRQRKDISAEIDDALDNADGGRGT